MTTKKLVIEKFLVKTRTINLSFPDNKEWATNYVYAKSSKSENVKIEKL